MLTGNCLDGADCETETAPGDVIAITEKTIRMDFLCKMALHNAENLDPAHRDKRRRDNNNPVDRTRRIAKVTLVANWQLFRVLANYCWRASQNGVRNLDSIIHSRDLCHCHNKGHR